MKDSETHTFIRGEIIDLLPLNPNHVSLYSKWENNPEVRRYSRTEIPITVEESKKYLETSEGKTRQRIMFEIWHKNDRKPIGFCEIGDISWTDRRGYIGFLIGIPQYWGQNIGTEMVK